MLAVYKIERQEKILQYINKQERASVVELSEMFEVSKVTIRSDIDELESKGLLNKTHGGAVSKDIGLSSQLPYEVKNKSKIKEKQKIADVALRYIEKKDIVILDSGSTTFRLVEGLPDGITVITPDILIAFEIIKSKKDIQVIMPGGNVDPLYTLQGIDTLRFFENLHADTIFLGCDGVDPEFGISESSREYAAIKRAMIESAGQVILMTDSSKFGFKRAAKVCSMKKVDVFITDKMDDEMQKQCTEDGVQVIVVK